MRPAQDAAAAMRTWESTADGARATLVFAADLPVFVGHFPGQPLVPGVHQLAAVAEAARRALGSLEVEAIDRAKWSAPAYPGQELAIEARWKQRDGRVIVDGTVSGPDGVCATCRLILRR